LCCKLPIGKILFLLTSIYDRQPTIIKGFNLAAYYRLKFQPGEPEFIYSLRHNTSVRPTARSWKNHTKLMLKN